MFLINRKLSVIAINAVVGVFGYSQGTLAHDTHGHAQNPATPGMSQQMQSSKVTAMDAWVPTPVPGSKIHAAYLNLHNNAKSVNALVSVFSPRYEKVEIHAGGVHDGVAVMKHLAQIELLPGEIVELKPGGLHLMLKKPVASVSEGDVIPLMLQFSDGAMIEAKAIVKKHTMPGTNKSHNHKGHPSS